MEFKIRKDEFLRGLYLAHGIADRKSTLPILANVLIRTEGKDKLLCGATDLNVTTMVSLSAKVEKEGGLTVAARQLYGSSRGCPTTRFACGAPSRTGPRSRPGKVEFKVVGYVGSRLPEAAGDPGGADLQGRVGRAARHDRGRRSSPCRWTRRASTWRACCSSRTARPRAWCRPTGTGCRRCRGRWRAGRSWRPAC